MLGFAGADGKVWGMESFGFSAAYGVLDQKLGFYRGENVAK
jgi:transketolase